MPFTYKVPAGMFTASTLAAANQMAVQYGEQQAHLRNICLSPLSNSNPRITQLFTTTITATGGQLAIGQQKNLWSISGFIPQSFTFNGGFIASNQASITGTPQFTDIGTYNFTITVQDPQGNIGSKKYTLVIGIYATVVQAFAVPLPTQVLFINVDTVDLLPGNLTPPGILINIENAGTFIMNAANTQPVPQIVITNIGVPVNAPVGTIIPVGSRIY